MTAAAGVFIAIDPNARVFGALPMTRCGMISKRVYDCAILFPIWLELTVLGWQQCRYFTARPFCSDHCGNNYQFYYCSEASFGCGHLGRGYCDWNGLLRCHP